MRAARPEPESCVTTAPVAAVRVTTMPAGAAPEEEVRHPAVPPANDPGEPRPIRGSSAVNDYPAAITAVNHVEPVPRRIRAFLAGETVLDTIGAR
jgi:hypothetical protein